MSDDGRPPRQTPTDDEGAGGSYTARPSKEPPAEGTTRDEEQEERERTGSRTDGAGGAPGATTGSS